MRTIHDYLDAAKTRNPHLKSDRRLALALELNETASYFWRRGKAWPADDTMIRLAALAGVNAGEALVDLNIWRAKSTETRDEYSRIAAKIRSTVSQVLVFGVTSALLGFSSPAAAEQTPHESTLHLPTYTLCDNLLRRLARLGQAFRALARQFPWATQGYCPNPARIVAP